MTVLQSHLLARTSTSYKPISAIKKSLLHGEHIAELSESDFIVNKVFKRDVSKASIGQKHQNVRFSYSVLVFGNTGNINLQYMAYLTLAGVVRFADRE